MTRPRLQLHLSTLLIVTVLAAGLVWLNVRVRPFLILRTDTHIRYSTSEKVRGCPLVFQQYKFEGWPGDYEIWRWHVLAVDIVLCLALLAVATAAIEWATRRMKRGAP